MTTSTWKIDSTHSGIHFSVRHMVFAKVRGRFGEFSGLVAGEPDDLTHAFAAVDIDARSIDTGVAKRDDHLRSADFFDVDKYPRLSFRSTAIEHVEGDRYQVTGELTIRDITREIVLDTEYAGRAKDPWGGERIAFTASASLDRKDFGLTWNQALETGGVLVGDRITIELEVQAVEVATASQAA